MKQKNIGIKKVNLQGLHSLLPASPISLLFVAKLFETIISLLLSSLPLILQSIAFWFHPIPPLKQGHEQLPFHYIHGQFTFIFLIILATFDAIEHSSFKLS